MSCKCVGEVEVQIRRFSTLALHWDQELTLSSVFFTTVKFHDDRLIGAPEPVCSRGLNKNPSLCRKIESRWFIPRSLTLLHIVKNLSYPLSTWNYSQYTHVQALNRRNNKVQKNEGNTQEDKKKIMKKKNMRVAAMFVSTCYLSNPVHIYVSAHE